MNNKLLERIISLTLQGYYIEFSARGEWDNKLMLLVRKHNGTNWLNTELVIPVERARDLKLNNAEERMIIDSINHAVTEIQKFNNGKTVETQVNEKGN